MTRHPADSNPTKSLPFSRNPVWRGRWSIALILTWAILLLSGCGRAGAQALPYVDLSQRTALPPAAASQITPLRMAVAAIISPQGTAESYGMLADYLGRKLNRPVELVHRRTYAEVNQLVETNQVDLAFVCTNAYVTGRTQFGMELMAAPEIEGESVYYSYLIVGADSSARSMADLRGKVFAFTDPMSFTGRTYPTYLLQELDETVDHFFSRTFFTYSHDRAIQAVANGVADAAAVDSIVLGYALERDPALNQKIRIIHRSQAFGIPPVVTSAQMLPRQKKVIEDLLKSMHDDPEGRAVLLALGVDRFVAIDDSAYAQVKRLMAATGTLP